MDHDVPAPAIVMGRDGPWNCSFAGLWPAGFATVKLSRTAMDSSHIRQGSSK
jgi:hypothetical protein